MTDDIGRAISRAAGTVEAPERLRAAVTAPPPRQPLVPRLASAGALTALVAALLLAVSGGGPTVHDVAEAALAPPQREATDGLRVGAIRFPDYRATFGWRAVGEREDRVGGRRAVTVIYRKGDLGVHYTVVDGGALDLPDGARRVRADGRSYAVLRDGDAAVVAWEQQGHTCVLASTLVGSRELLRFASWG